jgi:hypothetical protein
MKKKPVLCAYRLRHVPRQFSWVDQRLIRDGHIRGRSTGALALYLFLCTVADAQGLSYYSDGRVGELLGMESGALCAARRELQEAGLVAYARPFYQVLSLEAHKVEAQPVTVERQQPPPESGLREQAGAVVEGATLISEFLRRMKEGRRP